jgi:hypothetical protein
MANLDFLPNADFLGSGFQTQNVELLERQRGQELKAASYLLRDLPKGSPLFGIRTFYCSRVGRTPMRENRLARPNRAGFLGVVTSVMTKSNGTSLNSSLVERNSERAPAPLLTRRGKTNADMLAAPKDQVEGEHNP